MKSTQSEWNDPREQIAFDFVLCHAEDEILAVAILVGTHRSWAVPRSIDSVGSNLAQVRTPLILSNWQHLACDIKVKWFISYAVCFQLTFSIKTLQKIIPRRSDILPDDCIWTLYRWLHSHYPKVSHSSRWWRARSLSIQSPKTISEVACNKLRAPKWWQENKYMKHCLNCSYHRLWKYW